MTKFEEEVNKYNIFERTVYLEGGPKKILIDHFKNWHSDEEFQDMKAIEGSFALANKNLIDVNTKLAEEIANLKSQLQQQALPVVPERVADYISELKEKGFGIKFGLMCSTYDAAGEGNAKAIHWKDDNAEDFARAWLDGYEVEKPQLFKLIFPNSTAVLQKDGELNSFADTVYKRYLIENAMTEQEIKSIDERYWQFAVPVEDGE